LGAMTWLTAMAILFFVDDPAREDHASADNGFSGYLELLKLKALWPSFPLMGLNYVGAAGIRGLWPGRRPSDVYGADTMRIAQVTLCMAFAMVVGSFADGPLDTLFNTRKWVVFAGNGSGLAALTFLAMRPVTDITTVTVLFFIIGLT